MLLEIGLAFGLTMAVVTEEVRPDPTALFTGPRPAPFLRHEVGAKPEKPKWAPNRMKILHYNRKGRWVARPGLAPVDKNFCLPIEKVGI
jgi:hypothetical protein